MDDEARYELIYRNYAARVGRLANRRLPRRQLAQDVVQETFWRIFRSFSTLDPDRNEWPFIKKVAENVCRDMVKRRRRRATEELMGDVSEGFWVTQATIAHDVDLADLVVAREQVRCALDALAEVNPRQREALLDVAQGTPVEAIAARQGATVGATKAAVKRGRDVFKQAYGVAAAERCLLRPGAGTEPTRLL